MSGLRFRCFVIAALVASVAVPAASAKSGARVRLSVLPLPKSVIGPTAKSLPLQPDSGVAPNAHPARRGDLLIPTHSTGGATDARWKKVGRISGYALDYGLAASGGAGVTEVYTSVDRYKTSLDALQGLGVWQSADSGVTSLLGQSGAGGLALALKPVLGATVGSNGFAFLVSYSAANIAPVFGLDEQFTEGRYEADVTVWAGDAMAATKLAQSLARKLYTRIKLAREGRLHAKPVKLPPQQQPGPLPGGPDLSALAFQPSDYATFVGPGSESYFSPAYDPTALSAYDLYACDWYPHDACVPGYLNQDIEWCPSANQASFMADFWTAWAASRYAPVDLSSVGDYARGFFGAESGWIVLSSGQLMEFIEFATAESASDVQTLAQTAADKIHAAGLGS